MLKRIKWSLVKLPDDLGVFHVGGKTGARFGPESFQFCFNKFRGKFDANSALAHEATFDAHNGKIREHLDQATKMVNEAHGKAPFVVTVGGGHDFGYAQVKGLREANPGRRIGCINLDAHFDLRKPAPEITSGSPFYLLLEEGILKGSDLVEFGIQNHCNASELWDYAEAKKVSVENFAQLRGRDSVTRFTEILTELAKRVDLIAISLDLDCIEEASAPGVSAPQAEGFTPKEVFAMLRISAKEAKVVSLGIFELNPLLDRQNQTARVAAKSAHVFLEGKNEFSE